MDKIIKNSFLILKIIFIFAASLLYGCSNFGGNLIEGAKTTVFVTLELDSKSEHFDERVLMVNLYEHPNFIADVQATLVDSTTSYVDYIEGTKPFTLKLRLGESSNIKEDHKYYLSVVILDAKGERTHYGYKNGTDGFSSVLNESREVFIILKPISN